MRIGIGNTVPERSNLPGQSGGTPTPPGPPALAQIDNVYSMEFDGLSNDHVILDNSGDIFNLPYFSISLWYKPSATSWQTLIGNGDLGGGVMYWGIQVAQSYSPGGIRFIEYNSSFQSSYSSNQANLNQWNHVVVTKDATSGVIIYLNNTPTLHAGRTAAITYPSALATYDNVTIGSNPNLTSTQFGGLIDEVAVFDTTLTQNQVTAIYNAAEDVSGVIKTADLNDLTTPPVKWYRMGD